MSADPVDVRDDPQEAPLPQAISRKKNWIRAKKRLSEILLPVHDFELAAKYLGQYLS